MLKKEKRSRLRARMSTRNSGSKVQETGPSPMRETLGGRGLDN